MMINDNTVLHINQEVAVHDMTVEELYAAIEEDVKTIYQKDAI